MWKEEVCLEFLMFESLKCNECTAELYHLLSHVAQMQRLRFVSLGILWTESSVV